MSDDHHHMMHGHLDHHVDEHSHQSHADDHMEYKQKKATRQAQYRAKVQFNKAHDDVLHLFDHEHGAEAVLHHSLPLERRAVVAQMKKWVQRSFVKTPVAVMVSDLSGFTSTTRKYGIVHFASIIVRMRQLVLPILHHYQALHIGTEADNLIVVFGNAVHAARAAYEMQHVLQAYKYSLDQDRAHFQVNLNGIGIDYGAGVVVDREGKLHGEVANTAYTIGEEMCAHGCILMTQNTINAIKDHKAFEQAVYVKYTGDGKTDETVGKSVFQLQGHVEYVHSLAETEDMRYLASDLALFCKRHRKGVDLAKIDEMIRQRFMKQMTAVMFEIDFTDIEAREGAEAGLSQKFHAQEMLGPILQRFNAIPLEDVLHVFEDPCDAVQACLAMRNKIRTFNAGKDDRGRLHLTGFGVHQGNMIFVPGTDVHWGDPVNTSSKLGQDVAKDGEILITTPVYKAIERQAALKQCEFAPRKFTKSRVEFTCFSVTLPSGAGSHERPQHPAMHPNNIKQNESFKQFSIGVQCEMPGGSGSMASTRNVGHARPRGNVFGLPSGARQIQRYPGQLDKPRDNRGSIGKVLIHNMMNNAQQPFNANPAKNMGYGGSNKSAMLRVPNQLTETTKQRRKLEYERTTKGGLSQLGQKGDAMVLYPGTHGGHAVVVSPQKRRNDLGTNVTAGIGPQILRLGEQQLELKTTKRVMAQSNYNPVLGMYPARPPYAGNTVNPRASINFMDEAKRRTAPETLTGARPMRVLRDPNARVGDGGSVADNLTNYGHLGLAKIKDRGTLAREQSSGRGVVDTFKQMEVWSEDNYMPNPPITRFDGSGRGVSPRKRETYNRILQMEYDPEAESSLKIKEQNARDDDVRKRMSTGYNRQASYNIVSIRDRDTGQELITPENLNRGVKHVSGTMAGSSGVGSLLGASMQRRATIDPTNHPKFHFQENEMEHFRGGVHNSEEAYRDEGRQIQGANQLGKLVRYEQDGNLIRSHQREDQMGRTGEESF